MQRPARDHPTSFASGHPVAAELANRRKQPRMKAHAAHSQESRRNDLTRRRSLEYIALPLFRSARRGFFPTFAPLVSRFLLKVEAAAGLAADSSSYEKLPVE